jgi:16S rRNA (guanine527-N7)-methyltransferase
LTRSLNRALIADTLNTYNIQLSDPQLGQVSIYVDLLLRWNRTLNLTTITDPQDIVERHFAESMFAGTLEPVENCRLADLGTGAGFPGLALKIFAPSLRLILVESNKKKCAFLSEVARSIGFDDVLVLPTRFEDLTAEIEGLSLDYVTVRAVALDRDLLQTAKRFLRPDGHLMAWLGGDATSDLSGRTDWLWQPPIRLPGSQRRFLVVGRVRPKEDAE